MKRRSWLLLLFATIVACADNAPSGGPPAAPTGRMGEPALRAPGDAKIGDTTRCPVSGDEFVVSGNSPKVVHKGDTYYFCTDACKKRFEENPDKYLHPSGPVLRTPGST